ncbi:MAG: DUF1579 domain-containing protein [Pirellulaceae bacterium]|nr:DUF1579 domain-containing protein [Pirellulaceae bacterium]
MTQVLWIGKLALVLILLLGNLGSADDKKPESGAPDLNSEEAAKAFEAFAAPGKEHEQFKRLVGKWKTSVKSLHENPDEPSVTEGTATFRVLMGGRFMQQNFNGEFDGQKFQGIGITGFDNAKKKYVGTWIDSMGTGIMTTEGTYDPQTNSMVETGESSSPFGPMKMKMISKYLNDDKFTFTMFLVTPEGEQKMMEITYTRAE